MRLESSRVFCWAMQYRVVCLVLLTWCLCSGQAAALIIGAAGNEPITDPGWLPGTAAVFNFPSRVAYWEGPPFGGGQYVAECRGDAASFNAMLTNFARIEASERRLYVHDGVIPSFWLRPNGDEAQREPTLIDWTFTAWVPENWRRFRPGAAEQPDEQGPLPELHLYVGGQIHWGEVILPEGVTVIDERLEAHGYLLSDGTVMEGQLISRETRAPISGAVELQLITRPTSGGYHYETRVSQETDADGRWTLKSIPEGQYRVVAVSSAHVARTLQHVTVQPGPRWLSIPGVLAQQAVVTGTVIDANGQPLVDAKVFVGEHVEGYIGGYDATYAVDVVTDTLGRFRCDQVPVGKVRIRVFKEGYVRPGLGLITDAPADGIQMEMFPASSLLVIVEFDGKERPAGYIVEIEPEGGSVVGSWGGSGSINDGNQIQFQQIPPGRYVLKGRPNPGNARQETEPVTIELEGGKEKILLLKAK